MSFAESVAKRDITSIVCNSKLGRNSSNMIAPSNTLAAISWAIHCLKISVIKALVNDIQLNALTDSGKSPGFFNEKHKAKCKTKIEPYFGKISGLMPLWSQKLWVFVK